jgi:hypothetical protein
VRSEAARKKVERDFGKARTSIVTVDFVDESSLATMRDATLDRFGAVDHVLLRSDRGGKRARRSINRPPSCETS